MDIQIFESRVLSAITGIDYDVARLWEAGERIYDMPGIGKGAQMCVEGWYGFVSSEASEGYWEGNILSQKLGINNYELWGLLAFAIAAVGEGAATKQDLGLASIPQIDHVNEPEHGSPKLHHEFLTAFLNGIARKSSKAIGSGCGECL
jgi:hypothetical protein